MTELLYFVENDKEQEKQQQQQQQQNQIEVLPVAPSCLFVSSSRELSTDSYENCGILQAQWSEPDEDSDAEDDPTLRRA